VNRIALTSCYDRSIYSTNKISVFVTENVFHIYFNCMILLFNKVNLQVLFLIESLLICCSVVQEGHRLMLQQIEVH